MATGPLPAEPRSAEDSGRHGRTKAAALAILRRLRRWLGGGVGIVLLVLAIAWMSGALRFKTAPGAVPLAETSAQGRSLVQVQLLSEPETVQTTGTIQPRYLTNVESRVMATILAVPVHPGERVQEGQTLVLLDDREIEARVRDAKAALIAAEVQANVRRDEYLRYKGLYDTRAVAKQEFDKIEGAYRVAEQQVQQAKQQVAQAEVNRSYTRITAHETAIVLNRYADPGDLAAPGKPLLALHDPKDLEVHASVRENLSSKIQPGVKLAVEVDAVSLRTEVTVREIVPQARTAARSVPVKLTLPQDVIARLYAGMFARLWIPLGQQERPVVRADALQIVGQLDFVEVVNVRGMLERRFVRTGRRYGGNVEILAGLNPGETVALPLRTAASGSPPAVLSEDGKPKSPRRP